ncbi:MAG TPA: MarR family transcriptional regulator [Acidimicrobiales bacterium]|nr:MarR family transcriptional regulator [Acidimicrobiales bacterium]
MGTKAAVDQEMASRLRLVVARLNRRLRQHSMGDEMSPSTVSALATVEASGPISLGELAAIERVRPPSMTRIVARLEELGLVVRQVGPTDRRVALVRVTPAGASALLQSRRRKTAYLAARMRKLSSDDLRVLEEALPLLERLIEDAP